MSDSQDNGKQVGLNKSQYKGNFSDKFKTIQQQVFVENQESDCFKTIFESAAIGIAKVALHGKWLKVNRKVCEITGYSEDELLKLSFGDITHPDDLEADLQQVLKLLMGEINSYSLEKRYIRPDGSIIWVKINSSLVKEADNSEYFVVTIEDITNRKRIEKNQRLDFQALLELTERYQLAVGDSDIGIWDWNLESGDCVKF